MGTIKSIMMYAWEAMAGAFTPAILFLCWSCIAVAAGACSFGMVYRQLLARSNLLEEVTIFLPA
jgi:hypothetical protein